MRDDIPALTPQLLLHAYQAGIFPMAESRTDPELFWVDPRRRGILPLDGFHISRSLAKRIRTVGWIIRADTDFDGVVAACAEREDTWISLDIARLYSSLHKMGHAHSLEIWDGEQLVGGVYGVVAGTAFFGESMFSKQRDASKVALAFLTTHLIRCGFTLFDTQFLTDHLASLGAIEVTRAAYHALLHDALQSDAKFHKHALPSVQDVIQRRTQTS
ncbi:MAG: leucyl/phenylalanyl-tRNA--protein transferase [Planktotalea sp.]|uniref:leucyl/phenylalanyl-tRNA--protein transferase n=1 Tax=Planktotalea sp. TaxID=2029877 RepID=UPI003C77D006